MNLLFSIALLVTTTTTFAQYDSINGSKEHSKKQVEPKKPPHKWMRGCYGYVCPPPQVCRTTKGVPECVDVAADKSSTQKKKAPYAKTGIDAHTPYSVQGQGYGSPYGPRYSTPSYPYSVTQKHDATKPHVNDFTNFPYYIPGFRVHEVTPTQRPSNIRHQSPSLPQQGSPSYSPHTTPGSVSHPSLPNRGSVPYATPNYNQPNVQHGYGISHPDKQGISHQQHHTTPSYEVNEGNAFNPSQGTRNPYFANPNDVTARQNTTNPKHIPDIYVTGYDTPSHNAQGGPRLQHGFPDNPGTREYDAPHRQDLPHPKQHPDQHHQHPVSGYNIPNYRPSVTPPQQNFPTQNTVHHKDGGFNYKHAIPEDTFNEGPNVQDSFGQRPGVEVQQGPHASNSTSSHSRTPGNYPQNLQQPPKKQHPFNYKEITDALTPRQGGLPPVQIEVGHKPRHFDHGAPDQGLIEPVYKNKYSQQQHAINQHGVAPDHNPQLPQKTDLDDLTAQIEVDHVTHSDRDRGLIEPLHKTSRYSPQHHAIDQETHKQDTHNRDGINLHFGDLSVEIGFENKTRHSDQDVEEPLHKTKFSHQHSGTPQTDRRIPHHPSEKHGAFNDTDNRGSIDLHYGDLSARIKLGDKSNHTDYRTVDDDNIEPIHQKTEYGSQHSPRGKFFEHDQQTQDGLNDPHNKGTIDLRYGDLSAHINIGNETSRTDYRTNSDGLREPLREKSEYGLQHGPHSKTSESDPQTRDDPHNRDGINLHYGDLSAHINIGNNSHTDYRTKDDDLREPIHQKVEHGLQHNPHSTTSEYGSQRHNDPHDKGTINLHYGDLSAQIHIGNNSHTDYRTTDDDLQKPLHKKTEHTLQHRPHSTTSQGGSQRYNDPHDKGTINLHYGDLSAQIHMGNDSHADYQTKSDNLREPYRERTEYGSQQRPHSPNLETGPQRKDSLNKQQHADTIDLRYGDLSAQINFGHNSSHTDDVIEQPYKKTEYGSQQSPHSRTWETNPKQNDTHNSDTIDLRYGDLSAQIKFGHNTSHSIDDDLIEPIQKRTEYGLQQRPRSRTSHGNSQTPHYPPQNQDSLSDRGNLNQDYGGLSAQVDFDYNSNHSEHAIEEPIHNTTKYNLQYQEQRNLENQKSNLPTWNQGRVPDYNQQRTPNQNSDTKDFHQVPYLPPNHPPHNQDKTRYSTRPPKIPQSHERFDDQYDPARRYQDRFNVPEKDRDGSFPQHVDPKHTQDRGHITTPPRYSQHDHDLRTHHDTDAINRPKTATYNINGALHNCSLLHPHPGREHYNPALHNRQKPSRSSATGYDSREVGRTQDENWPNVRHAIPAYNPQNPDDQQVPENLRMTTKPGHDLSRTPQTHGHQSTAAEQNPPIDESIPAPRHVGQSYSAQNPQHGYYESSQYTTPRYDPNHPQQDRAFPQHQYTTPGYNPPQQGHGLRNQQYPVPQDHPTYTQPHSEQGHVGSNLHRNFPNSQQDYNSQHPVQDHNSWKPNHNTSLTNPQNTSRGHPSQGHPQHPQGYSSLNNEYNASVPYHPSQGHVFNPQYTTTGYGPHNVQDANHQHSQGRDFNTLHTTSGYGHRHSQQGHGLPNPERTTPNYDPRHPVQGHSFSNQDGREGHHAIPNLPLNEPILGVRHIEHSQNAHQGQYESPSQHTTPSYNPRHPPQGHALSNPPQPGPVYNPQYPQQGHNVHPGYGPQHPPQGHNLPGYIDHHPPQVHGDSPQHQQAGNVDINPHHTTPSYNPHHGVHVNPQPPQHGATSNTHHQSQGYGITPQPRHTGYGVPAQPLYPNLHPSQRQPYNRQGTTPQPYHRGYPGQPTNRRYEQYYPGYPYQQNYGNIYPISYGKNGGYRPTPPYQPKQQYLTVPN